MPDNKPALTTTQKVAGAGVGLAAGTLALAAVFIPHWESGGRMDLTVRQQPIDRAGVYTVCDGITNLDPDYAWIRPGMVFTEKQCAEAFAKVLPKYVEPIAKCIPTFYAMPPHRQVALISFSYNAGPGAICGDARYSGSIAREFNAGHAEIACRLMGQFIKSNGVVRKGLQNRRFDPKWGEVTWCIKGD